MKSIQKLYLLFSTMLFVVAVAFTAVPAEATCYTCTSDDPGGCPTTDIAGMTACDQSQDCYIWGAPCGKDWGFANPTN
ncbi:hypothetical protein [Rhodohalobacter sp.]|uniref:hypothetical protein n=1 Tax=Rhodohalobacter sp. TaxID=1974210 RepID=UPI002ACE69A0|nr:hypothetical protein [Rhodohalobacter sp.]MDZ7756259.1 hypothetical protein [Rhodohalobacter sp.]